ncbi:hypothetical protein GCM10023092_25560 [Rurimicrobium arvi]|uniref:DUF2589 domain-containing protein n=2 Tax=Rurimicrobium arvi TaxID=2049916 RepID=A0ABP8MZM7_9BACT
MAQQFSGLPIDSLIAGPLLATAKANANMAFTQTQFLLDTCFNKNVTGSGDKTVTNYTPIMIQMELIRGVLTPGTPAGPNGTPPAKSTNIQSVSTVFNLPLMTIMPLNSLAVDNLDVDFEMEVKSSAGEEQTDTSSTEKSAQVGFEAKAGWGPFSVTIHGNASYDSKESSTHSNHYSRSNSAKYTIKVHAGQLPLPLGVTTIIDAYAKNVTPIEMPVTASNSGGDSGK